VISGLAEWPCATRLHIDQEDAHLKKSLGSPSMEHGKGRAVR